MKLLDDNELLDNPDETEVQDELVEEEKDFLKDLEKMAEEVEDNPNSID